MNARIAIRNSTKPENVARNWNEKHPVGTLVEVTRDNGSIEETLTASEAWVMGGHSAVIKLVGFSGGYSLNRVRAIAPNSELSRDGGKRKM
jgi:hypothetical protein